MWSDCILEHVAHYTLIIFRVRLFDKHVTTQ
jgi:hypothetical protein